MGKFIVKLKEHYLEWSTIVDAPLTYGMTLDDLKEYIKEEYGEEGLRQLPERLERIEAKGTSAFREDSAVSAIWLNRAGPNESTLTIEGIYRHYCLEEPVQDEWIVSNELREDEDHNLYEHVTRGWDTAPDAAEEG